MTVESRLRRASLADLAAVLAIEQACTEASHWSESTWRGILQQKDLVEAARAVFVAEGLEHLSGFAVVQCVRGSAELENLAVGPEDRRQGVAGFLCRRAIAWASAQAAGQQDAAIYLEVRAGNTAALRLYTGLGFVEQSRRTRYYENPVEDAVLMAMPLCG